MTALCEFMIGHVEWWVGLDGNYAKEPHIIALKLNSGFTL